MKLSVIYKYPWHEGRMKQIDLPKGSFLLAVQNQRNVLTLWFLQPVEEVENETRTFIRRLTGENHVVPEGAKFIDTVQFDEGFLVYHIFEV